ncbi:APC family permease [Serinicoccus chungangensis]|uniref:APC family permease n=1 Tax=Serinicoccus chungangensis TaxID=767452 RepID=UPI00111AE3B1|nr:APC family permease [Serinicoccus chungangensis]
MTGSPEAPAGRQELRKTLRPQWVWAVALGSAIGWGAFVLPQDLLGQAGPLGASLGLIIGGALMCVIAVSYGLLIRHFPVSGGEYAYAYTFFGRTHAFIAGWALVLGYVSIIALNASALALLFRRLLPAVVEWVPLWKVAGWQVYLGEVVVASAALLIFAFLNARGGTLSGRVQYAFCLVMLAAVACILLSTWLHPDTPLSNLEPDFPNGVSPVSAVLVIVAIAPWAYVGFDNVPQAAEEFDFSPTKAFGLIVLAIVAAAGIYVAMLIATAVAQPWPQMVADAPAWGTADGLERLFGPIGLVLLAVAVVMGVSTGLNGFYVSASRLLFAMGRARVLPSFFAKINDAGAPGRAVWFAAGLCLIAPLFGREALLWVVDMTSVGVTIAYTYTCLAAYKLWQWSGSDQGEPDLRSSGRKVLSGLGALTGALFLGLLLLPGSPAQLSTPSWIALGVWVALGIVFYTVRLRSSRQITDEEMQHLVLGEHGRAPAGKGGSGHPSAG